MNFLKILAVSLLMALPAHANETWLEYIDWITDNSELTYDGQELPELVEMPYALMEIMVFGELTVAQCEMSETCTLPELRAYYDNRDNTIVVPKGADLADQEDMLVHELYHYLQYLTLGEPDCVQSYERPAYKAHWKWVEEQGLTEKYEEPNWLFVYLLEMACEQNEYDYGR